MVVVQILLAAFAAIVTLFILTRLMGNRQMSELSMFDYVMGISIGSIAAEMATEIEGDILQSFVAMIVFAAVDIFINLMNNKSRKLRNLFLGKALVLFDNGTLYVDNLRKGKLDLTEFLTQCRNSGYFDLSQLQLVMMEVNGRLSFLPAEENRPLTPADMSLSPAQTRPAIPVIMDGIVEPANLKASGNNEIWLQKQLKLQGFSDCRDVFLALVDTQNQLAIYERDEHKTHKNNFG